jgi:uncharacterized protein YkwD
LRYRGWWLLGAPFLVLAAVWFGVRTSSVGLSPAPLPVAAQPAASMTPEPKVLGASTPAPSPHPSPAKTATTRAAPSPAVTPTPAAASGELAPVAACPGQSDAAQATVALICMSSYARTYHGLGPIAGNGALAAAAKAKAQDMAACGYSHTACGRAFDYWMRDEGFEGNCTAENIAQGQQTPRAVFEAWMKSAGHRANILNPDYGFIGTAASKAAGGPMWVMELGGCSG